MKNHPLNRTPEEVLALHREALEKGGAAELITRATVQVEEMRAALLSFSSPPGADPVAVARMIAKTLFYLHGVGVVVGPKMIAGEYQLCAEQLALGLRLFDDRDTEEPPEPAAHRRTNERLN